MSKDKSKKPQASNTVAPTTKTKLTGEQRAKLARERQSLRAQQSVFGRYKYYCCGNVTKTVFRHLVKQAREHAGEYVTQSEAVFG